MNSLQALLAGAVDHIALKLAAVGAVIGILVGVTRGVIEQKYGSLRAWAAGIAAALLVGLMVHVGLHDVDMAPTMKVVITIGAAFVADDVLRGLRALGAMLGADPLGFVRRILDALRGGAGPSK